MPKVLSEKMMYALDTMVYNPNIEILFLGGSAGPGKTTALCTWLIEEAWRDPGSRAFIARETLVDLKKTTLITLFGLLNEDYPWMRFRYNGTLNIIEFENGSTIDLVELAYRPRDPDYNRFGGYEFTRGIIDEVGETKKEAMFKIFARIRYRLPPIEVLNEDGTVTVHTGIARLMMASNPTANWLRSFLIEDDEGNPVVLPDNVEVVLMLLDDHPDKAYVKQYKKTLSHLPDYDIQRLLHGSWRYLKNDDPFITEFRPAHHQQDCSIQPGLPLYFSFDFNWSPTSVLLSQKTPSGLEFDVEHQKEGGTELLCEELIPYLTHRNAIYATGDNSGTHSHSSAGMEGGEIKNDYQIIKKKLKLSPFALIDTRTANKSHEYSRRLCNYVLKNVPCKFSPRLKVLLNEIQQAKVDINGKLVKDRKVYKLDMLDAWRYQINCFFPNGIEDVDKYVKQINSRQRAMAAK